MKKLEMMKTLEGRTEASINNDFACSCIRGAVHQLSSKAVCDAAKAAGMGYFDDAERLIKHCENMIIGVPQKPLIDMLSMLVKRGMDIRKLAYTNGHEFRPKISYNYALLSALKAFSNQKKVLKTFDFVTMAYLSQCDYEWVIMNSVLVDPFLDEIRDQHRKARTYYLLIDESSINWVMLLHAVYIHEVIPKALGERPAKVQIVGNRDLMYYDDQFPNLPIFLGKRDSLNEMADKYKFDLYKTQDGLLLNGQIFAVPDFHPNRVYNQGLYRSLYDVRIVKDKVVIESPKKVLRSKQGLIIIKGHRYHIDELLPLFEIEYEYNIKKLLHVLVRIAMLGVSGTWKLIGNRTSNPWEQILETIDTHSDIETEVTKLHREIKQNSSPERIKLRIQQMALEFDLTTREMEVMEKVAAGKSNQNVAEELFVTEKTVKFHLTNIFQKTGSISRHQLMANIHR